MLICLMTSDQIKDAILDMGRRARAASRELVKLTSSQKNKILNAMAKEVPAFSELTWAALGDTGVTVKI